MNQEKKIYKAMIWDSNEHKSGYRVSVEARSLDEAMELLEKEYGDGNVFALHNEEDAKKPR